MDDSYIIQTCATRPRHAARPMTDPEAQLREAHARAESARSLPRVQPWLLLLAGIAAGGVLFAAGMTAAILSARPSAPLQITVHLDQPLHVQIDH